MFDKKKIILVALCFLVAGSIMVFKFKHEIKWRLVSMAVRVKHTMTGKADDPRRYNPAHVTADDGVAIFIASSLDRIFQDGKTLLKPTFTKTASISLAKNEYKSFQVVVQSQGRELHGVDLQISDLTNPATGSKIDSSNVSVRVVGYVPTIQPYYPVKFVGPWPDPLMPDHHVEVKSNITQPFWVTVYAPADTPAGDYAARITVIINNKPMDIIPLSVHVYNFVLPAASHLKTAFDFYGHITKMRYPQGEHESDLAYRARMDSINDKFIIMMLQYRMDPVLNVDPTNQEELANVDRYLVYGLNNFSIGKRGGTFDNNWPKNDESIEDLFSLYRTYGEDLKLNDMLQYTYIYAWDEGDMGNPQVEKITSMIHRAYPGLKTMVCYHGIWGPEDGINWIKNIDIWTFQIDDFDEQKMRKLQSMGKEIWMYVSGPAGTDTPNLAMDFDSIDYRIIPWLCWKYNIKGFLYWCVNWWPLVDPFENAQNSQWAQNGNGLLFYPGEDGPIASLRVELFRDGMEDYEYIQLLFKDLKILKRKHLDKTYQKFFDESVKLLTMDDSIVASMSQFTRDGAVLNSRRDAIARQIEEFNSFFLK